MSCSEYPEIIPLGLLLKVLGEALLVIRPELVHYGLNLRESEVEGDGSSRLHSLNMLHQSSMR